jgi:rubrerythrin
MRRRAQQNRRIETAMSRRLGKAPVAEKAAREPVSAAVSEPKVYLCKCNHVIDLTAGFDQCPKCGSALQFALPLAAPRPARR